MLLWTDDPTDPLAPARGTINGCLISAPIWAIVAIIAYLLTH